MSVVVTCPSSRRPPIRRRTSTASIDGEGAADDLEVCGEGGVHVPSIGPARDDEVDSEGHDATRDQLRLSGLGHAASPAAIDLAQEADRLGYHSGWTAEAYGTDAVTPLTWLMAHTERMSFGTAIMQMPARSPGDDGDDRRDARPDERRPVPARPRRSRGRRSPRAGTVSPYGKPLGKTREYVEIVREILRREAPLEHHGAHYDIPYSGPDATGLGKPLKLIVHPSRADIPIYLAAIGPKNVAARAEIARRLAPDLLLARPAPATRTATRSSRASRRPAATRASPSSTSRRP